MKQKNEDGIKEVIRIENGTRIKGELKERKTWRKKYE
jgi:hypothetical protein